MSESLLYGTVLILVSLQVVKQEPVQGHKFNQSKRQGLTYEESEAFEEVRRIYKTSWFHISKILHSLYYHNPFIPLHMFKSI